MNTRRVGKQKISRKKICIHEEPKRPPKMRQLDNLMISRKNMWISEEPKSVRLEKKLHERFSLLQLIVDEEE